MKKILIIGTPLALLETDQPSIADFVKEVVGDEVTVTLCSIDHIVYVVDSHGEQILNGLTGEDVANNDMVWMRGRLAVAAHDVTTIAGYLERKGVTVRNTFYTGRRVVGKLAQMFVLTNNGLPLPRTVIASQHHLVEYIAKNLTYPVILKDCYGSHGEQNYLVQGETHLQEILSANPEVRFMAQEFIKGTGDYRILIAGDAQLIIHRIGSGDTHLNNTSQGADAKLIDAADFSPEILADARKFAEIHQYEITGVDAIISDETGQHYFLELNSQPQLETGAFVTEKKQLIGNYFRNLLRL